MVICQPCWRLAVYVVFPRVHTFFLCVCVAVCAYVSCACACGVLRQAMLINPSMTVYCNELGVYAITGGKADSRWNQPVLANPRTSLTFVVSQMVHTYVLTAA